MNKVILVGRLAADPECKYTQDGTAWTSFTLAVTRQWDKDKNADFIDCVCFKKLAEIVANHLKKGSRCGISGEIQVQHYTDKDGNKRRSVRVIANEMEFLERKGEGGEKAPDVPPDAPDWSGMATDIKDVWG